MAGDSTLYYDYAYGFDSLCLSVPFLAATVIYYITYMALFRNYSHRIRSKKLVARYVYHRVRTRLMSSADS